MLSRTCFYCSKHILPGEGFWQYRPPSGIDIFACIPCHAQHTFLQADIEATQQASDLASSADSEPSPAQIELDIEVSEAQRGIVP
jgi:hypothetical protein